MWAVDAEANGVIGHDIATAAQTVRCALRGRGNEVKRSLPEIVNLADGVTSRNGP